MSLRNRRALKLPKLNPVTPEDHRQNNNTLTIWANDAPLNERVVMEIRRSTNVTVASGTTTAWTWDTVINDPYEFFNPSRDAVVPFCPKGLGGTYLVRGHVEWVDGVDSDFYTFTLHKRFADGSGDRCIDRLFDLKTTADYRRLAVAICTPVELNPNDGLYLAVSHAAGVNRSLQAANFATGVLNGNSTASPFLGLYRISE